MSTPVTPPPSSVRPTLSTASRVPSTRTDVKSGSYKITDVSLTKVHFFHDPFVSLNYFLLIEIALVLRLAPLSLVSVIIDTLEVLVSKNLTTIKPSIYSEPPCPSRDD